MKRLLLTPSRRCKQKLAGFSLIEVVLAIGIFLVTVLALVGLLGPTLQSVDEVEKTDEIASVVNTVNAFLQNSANIAPNASKFDAIYNSVASNDFATIFVFRRFLDDTSTDIQLEVGFAQTENSIDPEGQVTDFSNATGSIFRVVLTPSSVIPTPVANPAIYRSVDRNTSTETYTLESDLADYLEGYFAMEVRIYAEDPPTPGGGAFAENKSLEDLVGIEPLFTYNTAVVR